MQRTRGDRRLGTHVLAGVELLLPALLDPAAAAMQTPALLCRFPPARAALAAPAGDAVVLSADFMTDRMMAGSAAGAGCPVGR
jgi:hypothetical protein